MNQIPNRQAVCEVLIDKAKDDKDIIVLCSCLLYTSTDRIGRISCICC